MFSARARKDAAWQLIEYPVASPDDAARFHALTGDLPPRRSAWDEPDARRRRATRRRSASSSSASSRRRKIPEWERIASEMRIVGRARRCAATRRWTQALRELDARVDAILEKRRWLLAQRRTGDERAPARRVVRSSRRRSLVIGVFFLVPVARRRWLLSLTDFDLYALADLVNLRFVGLRQLRRAAADAAVLEGAGQHALLRRRRRAALDRRVARRGAAAQFAARALQAVLPHRAVRAGRHHAGRRRGDLALPVPHALRPAQLRARRHRHRADRLARRSALVDAGDHPVRGVEELRLQHDHPARRPAEHSARALRGGAHRRRVALAPASPRHAADARADAAAGRHPDHGRATSSSSPSPT